MLKIKKKLRPLFRMTDFREFDEISIIQILGVLIIIEIYALNNWMIFSTYVNYHYTNNVNLQKKKDSLKIVYRNKQTISPKTSRVVTCIFERTSTTLDIYKRSIECERTCRDCRLVVHLSPLLRVKSFIQMVHFFIILLTGRFRFCRYLSIYGANVYIYIVHAYM